MSKKITGKLLSLTLALSVILTSLCGSLAISAAPAENYAAGFGTREDPYLISTVEHLEKLDADTVAGNTDGKYYKLTADITLENLTVGQNKNSKFSSLCSDGKSSYVTDIKPFKGVFDGNNHTVTYTYNECYAYGGLFSGLEGAVVKNLTVKGTADGANVIFGSVAAVMVNSTIDNCVSEVEITNAKKTTGGIAGIMQNSVISNTENRGNIATKKDGEGAADASHGGIDVHLRGIFTSLPANIFQGGHSNIGGIVSTAVGGATFTNVLNTGNVANNADNGCINHTGGIVGLNYSGMAGTEIIFNSVGNTGNISVGKTNSNSNDRTGGIFGRLEDVKYYLNVVWNAGNISDSKSGTLLEATGSIGGSVSGSCGEISTDHIQKIYAKLGTVDDFTGTDCEDEFFGNPLYNSTTRYVYYSGDAYVSTKGSRRDMTSNERFLKDLGYAWEANAGDYPTLKHTLFSGGSGTEADPYIISSVDDLKELDADTVVGNTAGKYYKLTADLTIENLTIGQNRSVPVSNICGSGTYVTDIKPFKGVFNGNQHTVTYTYTDCYAYGGLFSGLDGAVVKNLTVKGTADGANVFFGSVAAVMYNSTIDNCVSEVEITNARKTTGGIVAIMQDSTISNTENRGNLTTKVDSAGAASVSHESLGTHVSTIFTSVPSSVMSGSESNIGGIVAYASGAVTFNNVLNSGNVSNNVDNGSIVNHTGGIVGKYYSSTAANFVMNSVGNTGNISVGKTASNTNDRTGGIYGRLEGAKYYLNVVWNAGTVTPSSNGNYPAQTGSIGGSVGGGSAAHDSVTDSTPHKIYAKIGTVIGYSGTGCQAEFLGNNGSIHGTSWIYYYGDAYESTNGSYRDMTSNAKFFTDLGDGWRKVDYEYPTLAYHYTIGDFNNDGVFNILDLVSVKKYSVNANTSSDIVIDTCDFDESGDVDATDLASVIKLLLGNELQDVLVSQNTVLRVYSQNVCSHGDSGAAGTADRLTPLSNRLAQRNPNIVVLTECSKKWAAYVATEGSYEVAANTRTGESEIQILYKADEFELVENKVDNSTRSAFHWVVLKSKKTGKKFMVYGYHGDSTDESTRAAEITSMNNTISAKNLPAVVAGDFNSEYSVFSSALSDFTRTAEGSAYDKPTWLGWDSKGSTKIDHILYSKNSFDARSYYVLGQKVGDTVLSDHCALLSELKLK